MCRMENVSVAFGLFELKSLEKANIWGALSIRCSLFFFALWRTDSKPIPQILLLVDQ